MGEDSLQETINCLNKLKPTKKNYRTDIYKTKYTVTQEKINLLHGLAPFIDEIKINFEADLERELNAKDNERNKKIIEEYQNFLNLIEREEIKMIKREMDCINVLKETFLEPLCLSQKDIILLLNVLERVNCGERNDTIVLNTEVEEYQNYNLENIYKFLSKI